jgi:hypothetical protein
MRTAIGTRRRIDWEHVIAQEKQFDIVTTLGTPIRKHKAVVTGRENVGMLSPPFESRQPLGKDIRIGKHCLLLVSVVLANCIRRASHEVEYAGRVIHGNLQEVVVKHMIPRCICAHMHRVVAQREVVVLSLLVVLNKEVTWG